MVEVAEVGFVVSFIAPILRVLARGICMLFKRAMLYVVLMSASALAGAPVLAREGVEVVHAYAPMLANLAGSEAAVLDGLNDGGARNLERVCGLLGSEFLVRIAIEDQVVAVRAACACFGLCFGFGVYDEFDAVTVRMCVERIGEKRGEFGVAEAPPRLNAPSPPRVQVRTYGVKTYAAQIW